MLIDEDRLAKDCSMATSGTCGRVCVSSNCVVRERHGGFGTGVTRLRG